MSRRQRPAAIVLLVAIGLAAAGWAAWQWLDQRIHGPGPLAQDTTTVIPRGASAEAIAHQLADEGIIAAPWLFQVAVRLENAGDELRAGEYAFPPHISVAGALGLLRQGLTVVRRLTIPEGLTSAEVVALVEAAAGLSGEIKVVPDDGALLPETYHYAYGDDGAELIDRMAEAMEATLAELWPNRAPNLPLETPEEALILASIVEEETGVDDERARVAAVFINRLRKGMPLQSDPTVAYGIARERGPLDRPLMIRDLRHQSPYNTYFITGLPPGPIANPGRAAIAAVLDPAETDELYFVADGSGGHAFARTLREHNRNVAEWRRIQRQRRERPGAGG